MADPLSITAGIVGIATFAHEVTKSVLAIKKLSQDIKNAPKELLDIGIELDNASVILDGFSTAGTTELIGIEDHPALQATICSCLSIINQLNETVSELRDEMLSKRRRTAWKIVREQERINAMVQKLHRSQTSLHLAFSRYESAKRDVEQAAFRMVLQAMEKGYASQKALLDCARTSPRDIQSKEPETTGPVNEWLAIAGVRDRGKKRTRIRAYLPGWISQNVWEACFERAAGRWTLTLTTSKSLPWHHVIFWSLRCDSPDDPALFKKFLETEGVSIHDRNDSGQSLFEVSQMAPPHSPQLVS